MDFFATDETRIEHGSGQDRRQRIGKQEEAADGNAGLQFLPRIKAGTKPEVSGCAFSISEAAHEHLQDEISKIRFQISDAFEFEI